MRLTIPLILAFVTATIAADPPQLMPPPDIRPPLREDHPLEVSPAQLQWTSAPQGSGEFLLSPLSDVVSKYITSQTGVLPDHLRVGDDLYLGTRMGLLKRTKNGPWQIVAELFGRDVRPGVVEDGRLWLDERSTAGVTREPMGLVALDLKTQKVVDRLPNATGNLVTTVKDGFLCCTSGFFRNSSEMIVYDHKGKEVWRKSFKGQFGDGQWIDQLTVVANAVWVHTRTTIIANYEPPGDFFRLDSSSYEITRHPGTQMPYHGTTFDRGAFLAVSYKRGEKDEFVYQIIETDAVTLTQRKGPEFTFKRGPSEANLHIEGDVLWFNFHLPFSRKTLEPIDRKDAGSPTASSELILPDDFYDLLAADGKNAWFIGGKDHLARVSDAGAAATFASPENLYALARGFPVIYPSTLAMGDRLAVINNRVMVLFDPDKKTQSVFTDIGEGRESDRGFFAALGGRADFAWLSSRWHRVFNFNNGTFIPAGKILPIYGISVIAGDETLWLDRYSWLVLRYNYRKEKIETVARWDEPLYYTDKTDNQQGWRSNRWWDQSIGHTYLTPDGKLGVVSIPINDKITQRLWLYLLDSATGTWSDGAPEWAEIIPVRWNEKLLGLGVGKVWQWKDAAWNAVADLPPALRVNPAVQNGRIFSTDKYLYVPSALGPYRVAWSDLVK